MFLDSDRPITRLPDYPITRLPDALSESDAGAAADLESADGEIVAGAGDVGRAPGVAGHAADAPLLADQVLDVDPEVDAEAGLAHLVQRRVDGRRRLGDGEIGDGVLLDEEDRRAGEQADVELVRDRQHPDGVEVQDVLGMLRAAL